MKEENKEKEIDLIALLLKFVRLIRRRLLLLIIILAASGVYAFISNSNTPPQFSTTMIARSILLDDVEIEGMISLLNELIDSNPEGLADKINLSSETCKKIVSLKASNIRSLDTKFSDPYKKRDSVFFVKAVVNDNNIIDSLQKGLIYYFENNKHVQERVNTLVKIGVQRNHFLDSHIQEIDSLSKRFKQLLKTDAAIDMRLDPSDFYETYDRLKVLQVEKLEEIRYIVHPIDVIEDFTKTNKPIGLGLRIILPGYLSGGFILWLIITGLLELRRAVISLERTEKLKNQNP